MNTKETAKQKITALVRHFDEQKSSFKKSDYNETNTRNDFIDPFFQALGWDVNNQKNYAESYREVIKEDRVRVNGKTKAPDYAFRLGGGKRLFFVEAKKPTVDIKESISPAYQVRRYAWSAKLPISILTNFEEFAVYDCTIKPKDNDNAAVARIKYLTYNQYLDEFDFLWNTFSKECVLKGSFDNFIISDKNKSGTSTVDKDFLASLDSWRLLLAKNMALRNTLSEDELNFAVQQTIDRLIFLRIAEDRHIEPYGNLKTVLKDTDFYQGLLQIFKEADEKYNSGIFDFDKDKITRTLLIDNKIIKEILEDLYYPKCPFAFEVMPIEIMGNAYEQFLGKIIRLSATGKTAKIEEKPEVRKAGGVFYTPQYIVDYIVQNTIGKLVEGKTPAQVSQLTICDPACGSGSFLIGAYQFLLDWHRTYYAQHPTKSNPLTPDTQQLTTAEKRRILLNNIYGVDLDANAVEVTKLSLLIKCMEGETEASINQQLSMFHERVLPSLQDNIKCGNSLIDMDYYDGKIDFIEERKVKPFSWQIAFPQVFKTKSKPQPAEQLDELVQKTKESAQQTLQYATQLEEQLALVEEPALGYAQQGGFDCVIGNPPYVDSEEMTKSNIELRNYAINRFETAKGNWDMYCIYTERAIKLLNANGYFGFIIPSKFLSAPYGIYLKQFLSNYQISNVEDYTSVQVFVSDRKISVYPIILIARKTELKSFGTYTKYAPICNEIKPIFQKSFKIELNEVNWTGKFAAHSILIDNILAKSKKINDYFVVENSATVNEAYLIKEELLEDNKAQNSVKLINTGTIDRYASLWGIEKTQYIKKSYLFPVIKIADLEKIVPHRISTIFKTKIVLAGMVKKIEGTIVDKTYYPAKSTTTITLPEKFRYSLTYLLGLLNSKLFTYVFKELNKHNGMSGGYMNVSKKQIEHFLFYPISFSKQEEVNHYNKIISLVDQLLQLHKDLQAASLPNDQERIRQRIQYNEDTIDTAVFALYGLSADEIKAITAE